MTLTARLNLFFLSALAVILIGFSTALYVLARNHLHRQTDERLDAALNTLRAGIEVTPQGLEWEPQLRKVSFNSRNPEGSLVWLVMSSEGQVVDRAGPDHIANLLTEEARLRSGDRISRHFDIEGQRWQLRQIWIESPNPVVPSQSNADEEKKYVALGITVGISLAPVQTTLRELAAVLVVLSFAVWSLALLAGRFFCRRALRPVTWMASSARAMEVSALNERLPISPNGDELEELGRAFNGLLERVQVAFERQRQFTGEASHQLRTPLTALLGQIDVTLRRERSNEEYRRTLGTVREQAEHLQRIVEALLFLARADAEAQLPQRQVIDLASWLPAYLGNWKGHPRAGDLSARFESAPVEVHPVLFAELLNILLDNAFKYSVEGTTVALEVRRNEGKVEIAVEDAGSGIEEKDLPHLFEPFFRSPAARLKGVEGLGLGLAVARRIADAFGAQLTVRSQIGKGSRFTLWLPVAVI